MKVGQLELAVGGGEGVSLERVCSLGVAHDQFGERVAFELGAQVHTGGAVQVVEPVAVLQLFELGLEHVVERAAEQATEQVGDLGETADPQVDVVETGCGHAVGVACPGAGAEHEVGGVGGSDIADLWVDDCPSGVALGGQCRCVRDRRVRAVGGDEVDQRLWVLEVLPEVGPVGVGRQLAVVGLGEDVASDLVEPRDAF